MPSRSAPGAFAPAMPRPVTSAPNRLRRIRLCMGRALWIWGEPPANNPRVQQNPFWDDRALRSSAGDYSSTPARHLACERLIAVCSQPLSHKPHLCHSQEHGLRPPRLPDARRWASMGMGARQQTGVQAGAKRRARCYSVLEVQKGSVDCVHQFRRPLLSSQERPSLQAPLRSRHPTLSHRRLTRTRRGQSRSPGQMSRR